MSRVEFWRSFARGVIMGIAATGTIMAVIIYSGQTFGQRCARAFPGKLAEQERCVHELVHGQRDYPSQQTPK